MIKQFLLKPDGSIPKGTNVAALEAAGIPLVLPTEPPSESGMVPVEREPVRGDDGVWRQVWVLETAVELSQES